jgi:hypothetical protein
METDAMLERLARLQGLTVPCEPFVSIGSPFLLESFDSVGIFNAKGHLRNKLRLVCVQSPVNRIHAEIQALDIWDKNLYGQQTQFDNGFATIVEVPVKALLFCRLVIRSSETCDFLHQVESGIEVQLRCRIHGKDVKRKALLDHQANSFCFDHLDSHDMSRIWQLSLKKTNSHESVVICPKLMSPVHASVQLLDRRVFFDAPLFSQNKGVVVEITWGNRLERLDVHLIISTGEHVSSFSSQHRKDGTRALEASFNDSGAQCIIIPSVSRKVCYHFYVQDTAGLNAFYQRKGGNHCKLQNCGAIVRVYALGVVLIDSLVPPCFISQEPSFMPHRAFYWDLFSLQGSTGRFIIRNDLVQSPPFSIFDSKAKLGLELS